MIAHVRGIDRRDDGAVLDGDDERRAVDQDDRLPGALGGRAGDALLQARAGGLDEGDDRHPRAAGGAQDAADRLGLDLAERQFSITRRTLEIQTPRFNRGEITSVEFLIDQASARQAEIGFTLAPEHEAIRLRATRLVVVVADDGLARRVQHVEDEGPPGLQVVTHRGQEGVQERVHPGPGVAYYSVLEEEWAVMQRHPQVGYDLLKKLPRFAGASHLVLAHHEAYNGGGYPNGLKGDEIPIESRVVLVCDAYHAMTTDRPYRKRLSTQEARRRLREAAGTQFDPRVVEVFLGLVRPLRAVRAA